MSVEHGEVPRHKKKEYSTKHIQPGQQYTHIIRGFRQNFMPDKPRQRYRAQCRHQRTTKIDRHEWRGHERSARSQLCQTRQTPIRHKGPDCSENWYQQRQHCNNRRRLPPALLLRPGQLQHVIPGIVQQYQLSSTAYHAQQRRNGKNRSQPHRLLCTASTFRQIIDHKMAPRIAGN